MATTTTSGTTVTAAPTAAVSKRPVTLALAAALLLLAALLTFASPFIRGRGFVVGNRPAGARQGAAGQGNGQGGFQGNGQGGFQGNGQGGAQGNGQGGGFAQNGQGGFAARTGANTTLFRFLTPIRIAEGLIGGIFTLVAALGIWQRKRWGMVMAMIVAVVTLLAGALSIFVPLALRGLARTAARGAGSIFTFTAFLPGAQWEAIVGMIIAVAVAVLVLLPVSQKAYVVVRKERRVM